MAIRGGQYGKNLQLIQNLAKANKWKMIFCPPAEAGGN